LESWSNQTGIEIDVITFCEAFIDEDREKMLNVFSQSMGMSYHTTILEDPDKATSVTNGGVCLFVYLCVYLCVCVFVCLCVCVCVCV